MAWLAALLAILFMAGCGGSDDGRQSSAEPKTGASGVAEQDQGGETGQGGEADRGAGESGQPGGEAENEAGERERALSGIPHSDRLAFVQIGTAIGDLGTSASVIAVKGIVRGSDTVALRRLRPNVKALRPRDPQLQRLRRQVLAALDQAIRSRRTTALARRSAPALLSTGNRLAARLKAYATSHPAIGAVVPD
jgi:hypothetical protein